MTYHLINANGWPCIRADHSAAPYWFSPLPGYLPLEYTKEAGEAAIKRIEAMPNLYTIGPYTLKPAQ